MPAKIPLFLALLLAAVAIQGNRTAAAADSPALSFRKDIAPIFADSCVACHNPKTSKGKLNMATFDALMKGGRKGASIQPGKPDESLLFLMMTGAEEPLMPKDADRLDDKLLARVELWIKQGAKFDGPSASADWRDLVSKGPKTVTTEYTMPIPTTALAFSPDGKTLAVAGFNEITFWDPRSGELQSRLPTKGQRIHALSYSGDGKLLLHAGGTPGRLGEVVLWELPGFKVYRQLLETEDVVFAAAFSPDGKQVAAGGTDRLFRIWDIATGKELHKVENHADWILGIAFTPDGKRILTVSRDKSAKLWDQTTKEPILTYPGHTDGVYGVSVSADGKTAFSAGADKSLRYWTAGGDGKEVRNVPAHGNSVYALRTSKSGNLLFTAGADKLIKLWNPANGAAVSTFTGHKDWVYSLAVSADEKLLASGAWNGDVIVWDIKTAKPVTQFLAVPTIALAKADAGRKAAAAARAAADQAAKAAAEKAVAKGAEKVASSKAVKSVPAKPAGGSGSTSKSAPAVPADKKPAAKSSAPPASKKVEPKK